MFPTDLETKKVHQSQPNEDQLVSNIDLGASWDSEPHSFA